MTAEAETSHAGHEHYDPVSSSFGMWLFLLTELLLFGALFIAFAWFYMRYRLDYHASAPELDRVVGAANTLVLLTSSLTVALALRAFRTGAKKATEGLLWITVALGLVFLVVKGFEWSHKFEVGLFLGADHLSDQQPGVQVFFGLYYLMTGLHAVHVIVGMVGLAVTALLHQRGRLIPGQTVLVENMSLYWHLVDVVWIYLFPLFYLIGR